MRRLALALFLVFAACSRSPSSPSTPASPAPAPVALADFSGYWSGTFSYTTCRGARQCVYSLGALDPFSLRLRQSGGRVTGVFAVRESIVEVSGDVQADGAVMLSGSSATGGSKGHPSEARFSSPALRLDPALGLSGTFSVDVKVIYSSLDSMTVGYGAAIVSANRGNLDAFVSDVSGTWRGLFLVKGCSVSSSGNPICSPFEPDEVNLLELNVSVAGDSVSGDLAQLSYSVPIAGRVRGRTLELEGFRPASPGTMALRVASFTATPDAFGRLAGTFSLVAESNFRSTTYQIELVQVVKTP
jgi:hypothetical protein